MRRLAIPLLALALIAPTLPAVSAGAAPGPDPSVKTVGQFAKLPRKERRRFAFLFMTTRPVDPCDGGRSPLDPKAARNVLTVVADDVHPGRDPADGTYVKASTPIGNGIRHLLANIGC